MRLPLSARIGATIAVLFIVFGCAANGEQQHLSGFHLLSQFEHPDGRICLSYGYTDDSLEAFRDTGDFRTLQILLNIRSTQRVNLECASIDSAHGDTRIGIELTPQHIVVALQDVTTWLSEIGNQWRDELLFEEVACSELSINSNQLRSVDFVWGPSDYNLRVSFAHPCLGQHSRGDLVFDINYDMAARSVVSYRVVEMIE